MTVAMESGSKPRMGRPPLDKKFITKPTMVRLTDDTRQRIEAVAGPNRMAEFIRIAIDRELDRQERVKTNPPSPRAPAKSPDAE